MTTLPLTTLATPAQESVWWIHQRTHNKALYNLTWRMRCDRPVCPDALALAWQAIVDRHDTLRTSLAIADGSIALTVHPHIRATIGRVEIDDPGGQDIETLSRLIAEEYHERVTSLEAESLARLALVRVGDRRELLLSVHHAVVDGWAVQLLLGELSAAYEQARRGLLPTFAADPTPFHVYADELRHAEESGVWNAGLAHWREALAGARATTLAADRPVDDAVGAAGTIMRYRFGDGAAAGIAALGRTLYATPFASMLAALSVVLARGGAGPDVTVGIVSANRMSVRDQQLVGYTANLCLARTRVGDDDTLATVAARSRDTIWATLAHQAVPYSRVYAALPDDTRAALGDASPLLLSYLGPIGNDLRLGDVGLTLLESPNRTARTDFAMSFWDADDGGFVAEIEYNTARFDAATVRRLLADVDAVLTTAGDEPERPVGTVVVASRTTVRQVASAPTTLAAHTPEASRSPLSHSVTAAWAQVLGRPPESPETNFFGAGGHSLHVIELMTALEAMVGEEIELMDWIGDPTPRRLLALLEADGEAEANGRASTLVWLRDGDGPHLHLVHGAGANVHDYREIVAAMPAGWRVTASQEREPLRDIEPMSQRYGADLAAAGLRPDILGGWSMGGQIAFALAASLDAPLPALAVLDATPPLGGPAPADLDDQLEAAFTEVLHGSLDLHPTGSRARTSGDPELVTETLAARLAGAGRPVAAAALAERWEVFRRHAEAVWRYESQQCVPTSALVVAADLSNAYVDEWADRLGATTRLRVDADHHGMLGGAAALRVAAALEALHIRTRGG